MCAAVVGSECVGVTVILDSAEELVSVALPIMEMPLPLLVNRGVYKVVPCGHKSAMGDIILRGSQLSWGG